jgi:hypothetical protein
VPKRRARVSVIGNLGELSITAGVFVFPLSRLATLVCSILMLGMSRTGGGAAAEGWMRPLPVIITMASPPGYQLRDPVVADRTRRRSEVRRDTPAVRTTRLSASAGS